MGKHVNSKHRATQGCDPRSESRLDVSLKTGVTTSGEAGEVLPPSPLLYLFSAGRAPNMRAEHYACGKSLGGFMSYRLQNTSRPSSRAAVIRSRSLSCTRARIFICGFIAARVFKDSGPIVVVYRSFTRTLYTQGVRCVKNYLRLLLFSCPPPLLLEINPPRFYA